MMAGRTKPFPAPTPTAPAWRAALSEFWVGVTDLAGLSLAIAAAGLVLSLGVLVWLFSPTTMVGAFGDYVPRSSVDADAFATVEAIRMGRTPAARPQVLVLGSSTLAQAFGAADVLLEELQLGTGTTWEVHMLTTPLQSPLDELTLLETALAGRTDASPPVVIVIGAGLPRLTWTPDRILEHSESQRIGLRSDWADAELIRLGGTPAPRTDIYAVDNRKFLYLNGLAALSRLALQRPAQRRIDVYAQGTRPDDMSAQLAARIVRSRTNLDDFVARHRRLADRVAAVPNTTLIYVDEPYLPGVDQIPAIKQVAATFEAAFEELSQQDGVMYWRVIAEADLSADHFYDPLHLLRGEAQMICQTTLAHRLVDLSQAAASGDG